MEESQSAPQAEVDTSASRPLEPQPAAAPALASFADAIASDVNRSEDREADGAASEPKPAEPASQPRSDVRSGGRRSAAAQANAARIAELERQLADRDPEKIRADLAVEQQREAETAAARAASDAAAEKAAWYQRVRDVPDRNLSDQEYRDREDYKAELDAYTTTFPRARTALEAQKQAELEAERAALRGEFDGTWGEIKRQMAQAEAKPHVQKGAIVNGTSFTAMADHLYDAGRASIQPDLDRALEENRRLKAESRQFRISGQNGLGAARAPINGGRSSAHTNGRPDFRTASSSALFEHAIRSTNGDD